RCGLTCGLPFSLALRPALLGLGLLRIARLLQLLALLGCGLANRNRLEDHHRADRLLASPHIAAREGQRPHARCAHYQPGLVELPALQLLGLGATSSGDSHSTRSRMRGIASESWILVTTSPVD